MDHYDVEAMIRDAVDPLKDKLHDLEHELDRERQERQSADRALEGRIAGGGH